MNTGHDKTGQKTKNKTHEQVSRGRETRRIFEETEMMRTKTKVSIEQEEGGLKYKYFQGRG